MRDTADDEGDSILVRAALAGDVAAIKALVTRLQTVILHRAGLVALRMRSGADPRQEALDLTQEVMLSLFEAGARMLRQWDPARGASLDQFVGLIAQRRAISLLRGRRVSAASPDGELTERVPANDPAPEAQAASRQEVSLLLERIQGRLSPLGLDLFYRLLVHEEPVPQICAETGLTANAVYIWRTRLLKLASDLAEDLHGRRAPAPVRARTGSTS